jgi:hypothetical protein
MAGCADHDCARSTPPATSEASPVPVVAEPWPPPIERHQPRRPSALQGKIAMAPDFDETPSDLIDAMEEDA